jgi:hypothetical protein
MSKTSLSSHQHRQHQQQDLQKQRSNLNENIEQVTAGLLPSYCRHLSSIAALNAANATAICDYISAMKSEINPSDHYPRDTIELLTKLARKSGDRNFKELTRDDIIAFLDTLRKLERESEYEKTVRLLNLMNNRK